MTLNLGALGDAAACGTSPCGWTDYVWVSDACQNYLACAGLPPMTFSGQLGAGAQSVASGVANIVASTASGVGEGVSSGLNISGTAMLAGVALAAILLLRK